MDRPGQLPAGWDSDLPMFPPDAKGLATRASSGKVLNALAAAIPELMGGSADLAPSNKTWISVIADKFSDAFFLHQLTQRDMDYVFHDQEIE